MDLSVPWFLGGTSMWVSLYFEHQEAPQCGVGFVSTLVSEKVSLCEYICILYLYNLYPEDGLGLVDLHIPWLPEGMGWCVSTLIPRKGVMDDCITACTLAPRR